MSSANFKPKRTLAASRGFLAAGRLSFICFKQLDLIEPEIAPFDPPTVKTLF